MVFIISRGRSEGTYTKSRDNSKDPEFLLMKRIDQGNITDAEINQVVKDGGEALKFMEAKADRQRDKMKHVKNVYGDKAFDGVDNDGNLYKDNKAMDGMISNPKYDEATGEKIKEILKDNPNL